MVLFSLAFGKFGDWGEKPNPQQTTQQFAIRAVGVRCEFFFAKVYKVRGCKVEIASCVTRTRIK
jgi:hypothetical protein